MAAPPVPPQPSPGARGRAGPPAPDLQGLMDALLRHKSPGKPLTGRASVDGRAAGPPPDRGPRAAAAAAGQGPPSGNGGPPGDGRFAGGRRNGLHPPAPGARKNGFVALHSALPPTGHAPPGSFDPAAGDPTAAAAAAGAAFRAGLDAELIRAAAWAAAEEARLHAGLKALLRALAGPAAAPVPPPASELLRAADEAATGLVLLDSCVLAWGAALRSAARKHDALQLPGCPPLAPGLETRLSASPLAAPAGSAAAVGHLLVDLSDVYALLRKIGALPADAIAAGAVDPGGSGSGAAAAAQPGGSDSAAGERAPGLRAARSAPAAGADAGEGPQLFARSTSKFWVPLDQATALKCAVARHLPLLIYGRPEADVGACGAAATNGANGPASPRAGTPTPAVADALITSVYYENKETFEAYESRLARTEGATLVRLRWYGPISAGLRSLAAAESDHDRDRMHDQPVLGSAPAAAGPAAMAAANGSASGIAPPAVASSVGVDPSADEAEVFVERKTHHEAFSGLLSCKERFALKRKQVPRFLAGTWAPRRASEFAQEVLTGEILGRTLRPLMRTSYVRTAFQAAPEGTDFDDAAPGAIDAAAGASAGPGVRVSVDVAIRAAAEPPAGPGGDAEALVPRGWRESDGTGAIPPPGMVPVAAICAPSPAIQAAGAPRAEAEPTPAIAEFPMAVLEVKLHNWPAGVPPPAWLAALASGPGIQKCSTFSKYVHGTACLFPDRVPRLPPWLLPADSLEGLQLAAAEKSAEASDAAVAAEAVAAAAAAAAGPAAPPPAGGSCTSPPAAATAAAPSAGGSAGTPRLAGPTIRVGPQGTFLLRAVASSASLALLQQGGAEQSLAANGPRSSVAILPTPRQGAGASAPAPAEPHVAIAIRDGGPGAAQGRGSLPSNGNGGSADRPPGGGGHDVEAPPSAAPSGPDGSNDQDDGRSVDSSGEVSAAGRSGPRRGTLIRGWSGGCFRVGGGAARYSSSRRAGGGADAASKGLKAAPGPAGAVGGRRGAGGSNGGGGGGGGCLPRGVSVSAFFPGRPAPPLSMQVKVEPKTFFANERTLLQWLSSSILVVFTALSLLTGSFSGGGGMGGRGGGSGTGSLGSFAGGRGAALVGAILAPVGIAFIGYALYTYVWRARMIARRQLVRYDDQVGPFVLVVGLLIAVSAGYVIIIMSHDWSAT